jgi:hypothetical protein
MIKYQSFVSEHTVEYILVPRFIRILKKRFESVIPVFPWITREGSSFSKLLHRSETFKLVGLFPRRPKYENVQEDVLYIKINFELIENCKVASDYNIPLVAGCPIIQNIWQLKEEDILCAWIKINQKAGDTYQLRMVKDKNSEYQRIKSDAFFKSEDHLLRFIGDNCKVINFAYAVDIIRKLNGRRRSYPFFFFGSGYKPVYFLLKDFIDR